MPLPSRKLEWLLLAAVVALTAALYSTSLGFAFVYDDHNQIENNPAIQSWQYFPTYFTSHVWSHKAPTGLYYRPVFLTWLLLNYKLFALNAAWWHLSTLALHLVSTLLVYFLARRLTGDIWISFLSALLFGVYPGHVEAVDWVSGGTEPLFAVFFVAAFLCYLHRSEGYWWRAGSILLASCAVLAKETGVVFPGIVFAYEWFASTPQLRVSRLRTSSLAALPYALIVAAYLAIRKLALGTFASRLLVHSYWDGLSTWPAVIVFYLRHMILPVRLSAYYNFDWPTRPGLWNFGVPLLEVCVAGVLLWLASRLSARVAFLIAWMLLSLLPVLALPVFGTGKLLQDRYLYAPSMAFCILLAMAVCRLRLPPVRVAAAIVLCSAFAWTTVREGSYWADGITLNQRGLIVAPGNVTAMQNLGAELMQQRRLSEAIGYFLQVLERRPDDEENLFDLGLSYYQMNVLPLAEQYFERACRADPLDPRAHLFLGVSWGKQGRLDDAEREIRQSIALQRLPQGFQGYHLALGDTLEMKGDFTGALQEFRKELDSDPDSAPAADAISRIEGARRF